MGRSFDHIAHFLDLVLGLLLVVRILSLRLQRTYLIFTLFLIADLLGSVLWLMRSLPGSPLRIIDYRVIWLCDRLVVWGLLLWTVLALLNAVLVSYPGIASLSRRSLNISFLAAICISVFSAFPEYFASQSTSKTISWQAHAVLAGFIAERVVFSIALLAMLAILTFLLWFPVEIPRNLVLFTTGFLVYFFVINSALLARSFWMHSLLPFTSVAGSIVSGVCFAYWGLFLSQAGEVSRAAIHVKRRSHEQERLIQRLELLNDSLLRAARR